MKIRYFDNAATTRVDDEISEIIRKYNGELYFNASANYSEAVKIHNLLEGARQKVSDLLKGYEGKLYFLSSGSEGDNQAIICAKKRRNGNIVISAAEHPAVYNTAMSLKNAGYELRLCPVDMTGRVQEEAFAAMIDENTTLVSVMHVNNETGGVNDIAKLVKIAKKINPHLLFHSDGVQALGKVPVNLAELGVDLYTFSGHKIGAPKGIAGLYVKKGVYLSPLIYGGGQEGGLRSSTENISGIMAFTRAIERATSEREDNLKKFRSFADIIKGKLASIEDLRMISDDACAGHILTFAFRTVRGEVMQHALSQDGFLVGTGSACSSTRAHDRVPKALGLGVYADGLIRVSFGRENTEEETVALADALYRYYKELRITDGV